jgi:hypothetical protein
LERSFISIRLQRSHMKSKRKKPLTVRQVALKHGFRSGLEDKIAERLTSLKVPFEYEQLVINYIQPAKARKYTPDFVLLKNDIIIESKGRFMTADRQKHLMIKEQYPELDIRFVFSNSKAKLSKLSQTTYGDWCTKHGFLYADKDIPEAWLNESRKGYK